VRPRKLVLLKFLAPDVSNPQGIARANRKLDRDYPWVLEEGWPVEYWGIRTARPSQAKRGNVRVRGPHLPTRHLPFPLILLVAWVTHFLLALRFRNNSAIMIAPVPLSGAGVALARRLCQVEAPLIVRVTGRTSSNALLVRQSKSRGRLVEMIERFVMLGADLVLPMGSFTRRLAIAAGVDEDRISELPFPAVWGKSPVLATELPVRGTNVRVLCAARLIQGKGVDVLLEAFADVLENIPSATLHIAGDGTDRASLERLAATLGLTGAVHFHGWLDPPSMLEFFCSGTVAVLPSRWEEGLGMALVEAGLAGCALIGSDLGGIREIVRPGETGFLVPPDDASALARVLRHALSHPEETRLLGAGARRAAEAYLSTRDAAVQEARQRMMAIASLRPDPCLRFS
jgi:glycosyltransferase involved in cell wall biosynthesis